METKRGMIVLSEVIARQVWKVHGSFGLETGSVYEIGQF